MYPFLRLAKEMLKFRNAPKLGLLETHVSAHMCLPWDLDPWNELNNGRTLTLYDLGRMPMARRVGLDRALRSKGWGLTVAGASTRYRRRITVFDRLEMRSRCIGWDARFIYMEQSLWKGPECCNHMLLRSAVVSKGGIVAPQNLVDALGAGIQSPDLPGWVQAWIAADGTRPWPPQR